MKFNVDMERRREGSERGQWYRWCILILLFVCAAGVWYAGWKLTRVAGEVDSGERPNSIAGSTAGGMEPPVERPKTEGVTEGSGPATADPEPEPAGTAPSRESEVSSPLFAGGDPVTTDEVVRNRFFWPQKITMQEDATLPVLYERIRVGEANLAAGQEYFVLRVLDEGVAVLVDGDEVVVPFGMTDLMDRVEPLKDDAREAYRIEQQRGFIRRAPGG